METLENINGATTGQYDIPESRDDEWCSRCSDSECVQAHFGTLNRKRNTEIFVTVSCHFDTFRHSQWRNLQNDNISVSVYIKLQSDEIQPVSLPTISYGNYCDHLISGMVFPILVRQHIDTDTLPKYHFTRTYIVAVNKIIKYSIPHAM